MLRRAWGGAEQGPTGAARAAGCACARAARRLAPAQYNTQFGYSRKDVILIGAGITALGCGLYYGLQVRGAGAGGAADLRLLASWEDVGGRRALRQHSSGWFAAAMPFCAQHPAQRSRRAPAAPAHSLRPVPRRPQAAGLEPGIAGNFVQLFVILGISLGWVGSYLYRVATKVRRSDCFLDGQSWQRASGQAGVGMHG